MEEYLTTDELCERIKYQKQTIYNLIHRKVFIQGKHFFKPTPRKILFKWSEIQSWIGEDSCPNQESSCTPPMQSHGPSDAPDSYKTREISLIRI